MDHITWGRDGQLRKLPFAVLAKERGYGIASNDQYPENAAVSMLTLGADASRVLGHYPDGALSWLWPVLSKRGICDSSVARRPLAFAAGTWSPQIGA